jgi:hypothetical protein
MSLVRDGIKSVCVFCASSDRVDQKYKDTAFAFGGFLAAQDLRLVYGGAQSGLMGAVADGALAGGGEVVGVMPEVLSGRERTHKGLGGLIVTKDMHERQQKMSVLADVFVVLPGGTGTLAEFFEVLTWKQIGLHQKPIVVCNAFGFWSPLFSMMNTCLKQGFLHENPETLYHVFDNINAVQNFFFSE